MIADIKYLNGYRTAENQYDFRHTAGNMGQLDSFTAQEYDRLKLENFKNAQLWKVASNVKKIKDSLHKQNKILVNSDKALNLLS